MKPEDLKPIFKNSFPHIANLIPRIPFPHKEKPREYYNSMDLLHLDFDDLVMGWYTGNKEFLKILLLLDKVIADLNSRLGRNPSAMMKTAIVSTLIPARSGLVKFIGQLIALCYILENNDYTLEVLVAPNHNGFDNEFIIASKDQPVKKLVTVTNLCFVTQDLQCNGIVEKMVNSSANTYPYKVNGLESILQQVNVLVLWSPANMSRQLHAVIQSLSSSGFVSSYSWILSSAVFFFPNNQPIIRFGDFTSILTTEMAKDF